MGYKNHKGTLKSDKQQQNSVLFHSRQKIMHIIGVSRVTYSPIRFLNPHQSLSSTSFKLNTPYFLQIFLFCALHWAASEHRSSTMARVYAMLCLSLLALACNVNGRTSDLYTIWSKSYPSTILKPYDWSYLRGQGLAFF